MEKEEQQAPQPLTFRMHPRVLAALGRDLVTNDVVAVIELVKNSYDALATRVEVLFDYSEEGEPYLEISDDGHGMDRTTLEDVWCVVATPFRKDNPEATHGRRTRRVTGDKGLGRLSAARLGQSFELTTRASGEPYLRLVLDWAELSSKDDLDKGTFLLSEVEKDARIGRTGTALRISQLSTDWSEDEIVELRENLGRLMSPFSAQEDFRIFLSAPGQDGEPSRVEIESPDFLSKPKYAIRGHVDGIGDVSCKYEFRPISEGRPRHQAVNISWAQIYKSLPSEEKGQLNECAAECGPFEFEIRAWDLTSDDTFEIHRRFDIAKASIRKAIRAHKGISVYRDDILVLPKSDDARDWLGLDLRRVSRVGTRLSTSQLVGYVQITKERNPRVEDTSDRERLASNAAVTAFQRILLEVVAALEVQRDQDRREPKDEQRLVGLFEDLTADELLAEMVELAEEGATAADALPTIETFNKKLDRVRAAITKRFTYYSRLATVGTIAQMLIHEIRNRTTAIHRVLRKVDKFAEKHPELAMNGQLASAQQAVAALESLADRFAPLASRSFRRGGRVADLLESMNRTLGMLSGEIEEAGVELGDIDISDVRLAIDPGELDSVFLNLVSNALYWLGQSSKERRLEFRFSLIESGERMRIYVDDSGTGIPQEDEESIFWPGVTRKPGGIGMGLTVASELVAEHGGRMGLVQPGRLGGATMHFDLPLAKR